ncbi:MAG TPA: hypothetical protein VES02_07825 [Dermatophilaceae bacterium]|nr:hypothetical protein [Dermatophilaceae bacterium]
MVLGPAAAAPQDLIEQAEEVAGSATRWTFPDITSPEASPR